MHGRLCLFCLLTCSRVPGKHSLHYQFCCICSVFALCCCTLTMQAATVSHKRQAQEAAGVVDGSDGSGGGTDDAPSAGEVLHAQSMGEEAADEAGADAETTSNRGGQGLLAKRRRLHQQQP